MKHCRPNNSPPKNRTPFPWFGNKRAVADVIWSRIGDVRTFVDPFCGANAVLLARPADHRGGREIVNDLDGLLANFWRAAKYDPEAVLTHATDPIIEVDLYARQNVLVDARATLPDRLRADAEYFDAKLAGWWLHGQSASIGSNWCSARDKARLPAVASCSGILAACGPDRVRWVAERIADVRIVCGDWSRLQGRTTLNLVRGSSGATGIVLDPPYGEGASYAVEEEGVATEVWRWATSVGDDARLRIAVCGYEDGRVVPHGWTVHRWDARARHGGAGYANLGQGQGRKNAQRETIWFSPHCLAA